MANPPQKKVDFGDGSGLQSAGALGKNAATKTSGRPFCLPETNSEFTPENGWLEYDPASFLGQKGPIFRGFCC